MSLSIEILALGLVMCRQRTKLQKLGWRQLGLTVDKWEIFYQCQFAADLKLIPTAYGDPWPLEASFVGFLFKITRVLGRFPPLLEQWRLLILVGRRV